MTALIERPANPWPTDGDMRRATEAARGDNTKIAELERQASKHRAAYQHACWPLIPPVVPPADIKGTLITLDCEVITNTFPEMRRMESWGRAKVVGIGDGGLPGRVVLKVRPYGSNYLETVSPRQCEVHAFDEYGWIAAGEKAARRMADRNIDLARCLWGHFYFEEYQREVARAYVGARG